MSNLNFDKNGLDGSGVHWLEWAALINKVISLNSGYKFNLASNLGELSRLFESCLLEY